MEVRGETMLTFKNAPKTLLGPCEHALWDGGVFMSRHHIHMPEGVEEWRARVNRLVKSTALSHIVVMVDESRRMNEARRLGMKREYADAVEKWGAASEALQAIARRYGLGDLPYKDADPLETRVEHLTTLLRRARKWVAATPAEWPNDEVITIKKDIDEVIAK
jgi:hypothetical protein